MSVPRAYKNLPVGEFKRDNYTLVPIRDADKYPIMQWRNEQIDILRQKEPLTREGQERYFKNVVDKLFETDKPDQLLFSFLENDKLVGYGGLVHIDWESGNGEISFITETSRNQSPAQFKKDWSLYLGLLKQLTQSQLKFFKIYTYAYDVRPYLFEMLLENNFREEARMHKHIRVAGVLRDVLIHSYLFDDLVFRAATEADMKQYFEWANDDEVRKSSFSPEKIPFESHQKWFSNKLKQSSASLFVVTLNDLNVGQIRFDEVSGGKFEIDFSIGSDYRGRGLGSKILQGGVNQLINSRSSVMEITGKVKATNNASINSFEGAGFKKTGSEDGVVIYSLTNN